MENKLGKYDIIGVGIFLSIVSFLILFGIRYYNPILLDIDAKWLLVSSSPVLISLILAGIIKNFKGFGVEFEVAIADVEFDDRRVISYYTPTKAERKDSLEFLYNLSDNELRKITVLSFVYGRRGYYDSYAIEEYFKKLRYLRYILILDENNKFLFLIKKEAFRIKSVNQESNYFYSAFIRAIEDRNLSELYKPSIVSDIVKYNDTILNAVKLFKKTNERELPIINENSDFIGFIKKEGVYELATDILLRGVSKEK